MVAAVVVAGAYLLALAPAPGDIVYMKDGQVHRGEVTEDGERVLIRKALATIAVDRADVRKIVKTAGATKPKPTEAPTVTLDTPGSAEDDYQRPESHVFALMRREPVTLDPAMAGQVREQIKQWQVKVHDDVRKVRTRWLDRSDRRKARAEFAEALGRGRTLLSDIRRVGDRTESARARQAALRRKLGLIYRQAARHWPDDLVGGFLMAAAMLEGVNYAGAQREFERCIERAPRVAAFHQGKALALLGRDEHPDALAAMLGAIVLQPDSRDALHALIRTMDATPGAHMTTQTFTTARAIVELYDESVRKVYTRRGTEWLMPGRGWHAQQYALPTPDCERLVFRQAVGVPVGKHALLVDRDALDDALEVFVVAREGMVVPADVQAGSTYRRAGQQPSPVGLVLCRDVEFSPLPADSKAGVPAGADVTAHTTNLYEEMGSEVRPVKPTVRVADGSAEVTDGLAPGETSAGAISADGHLVGFLAGRTDPLADGGGDPRFVALEELSTLVRRGQTSRGGYGARRKITPTPVEGRHFLVHVTAGEKPRR